MGTVGFSPAPGPYLHRCGGCQREAVARQAPALLLLHPRGDHEQCWGWSCPQHPQAAVSPQKPGLAEDTARIRPSDTVG